MKTDSSSTTKSRPFAAALPAAAVLMLVVFSLLPGTALAGPPTHPPLGDPLNGFALDHACGAATDSDGNIYVANSGNDKVEVFDPDGNHLASINDANGPCGLAVDSNGRLYVSETSTGTVVRFNPDAFPLTASPSYSAPTTIDSSGQAHGISVDPTDDLLFVAEGDHVAVYNADGTLGFNEVQRVALDATGGTYTLTFDGQTTSALAFDASAAQIQTALEALSTIGAGNVSVADEGGAQWFRHVLVAFSGTLAKTNVPQLTGDESAIIGPGFGLSISTTTQGYSGRLGSGELTNATGVAVYRYLGGFKLTRYVAALDDTGAGKVALFSGMTSAGSHGLNDIAFTEFVDGTATPDGSWTLGADPVLGIDQGNGHLFVYDDGHQVVDEFQATGNYVAQIPHSGTDAVPTAVAVDRSGGGHDGTVYVSAGSSAGATLSAFAPFAPASRTPLPNLSKQINNAFGAAVDSQGNYYVSADQTISIFSPTGSLLATINDPKGPRTLAVDSTGVLYALREGGSVYDVARYVPNSYPITASTTYSSPTAIVTGGTTPGFASFGIGGIAVNPTNDHLFVVDQYISEFDSAASGNALINLDFAGVNTPYSKRSLTFDRKGRLYVNHSTHSITIISADGSRVLNTIQTAGEQDSTAIDESSGNVLVHLANDDGTVAEYEPSGALVGTIGGFTPAVRRGQLAVDNSGGPNTGNLYVSWRDDLSVFGPLSYGEPPVVAALTASNIGAGIATLNATVNPKGFALSDCHFDYVTDAQYQTDGETFASATSQPCAETLGAIGTGTAPVDVHADISGLDLSQVYRFRIVAANQFGNAADQGLFGPPIQTLKSATGVHYTEAILRARLDPSGLPTTYHFEYGNQGPCSANPCTSTAEQQLDAIAGPTDVQAPIFGLDEGTAYYFRLIAANAAGDLQSADQSFTTYSRPIQDCSNSEFRVGRSHGLPDCRAYELVTPADSGGALPYSGPGHLFNIWPVTPAGPEAGDRATFTTDNTMPGFDGSGQADVYRATRGPGGWQTELFSPTYELNGGFSGYSQGISPDQLFGFWETGGGTLGDGQYVATPQGFELLGHGANGDDPGAVPHLVVEGGSHIVFSSTQQLEDQAPSPGTRAIYDRSFGGGTEVVSLLPDGSAPSADATFVGASRDGSAVAFSVSGTPYVRRDGTTSQIGGSCTTFAGISEDGAYVFCAADSNPDTNPAGLYRFDVAGESLTQIASNARFVNVSADGSTVYFVSTDQLDPPAGAPGAPNLYVWDGSDPAFVAEVTPGDLASASSVDPFLTAWTRAVNGLSGLNSARTVADGSVLVLESEADLTSYQAEGTTQLYRYDRLSDTFTCVSCPSEAPQTAHSRLRTLSDGLASGPSLADVIIPSLTADGNAVVFESDAQLGFEDQNQATDVYRWQAEGEGGCARVGGCVALVSGGRGDKPSYLYAMTPDGRDILITSRERLHPADPDGATSIYDARVDGGFAAETTPEPCVEDGCQGPPSAPGSAPPSTPGSGSSVFVGPGNSGRDLTPQSTTKKKKKCKRIRNKRKRKRCRRAHKGRARAAAASAIGARP